MLENNNEKNVLLKNANTFVLKQKSSEYLYNHNVNSRKKIYIFSHFTKYVQI